MFTSHTDHHSCVHPSPLAAAHLTMDTGELQDRTLQYYDYLWNRHRTFDPACVRFTADLSPTLRKEILLHMNRECVMNCDFFRDVSNECIIRLVHSFKFAVFLSHDVLAEEGELAAELVFLIHGSAKVTKLGKSMPVSLLKPGDYFGEKSLLMHHRNAVSVVAIENCDTRVLEKDDFEDLTIDFPELRESILKNSDHMDVTEYDKHTRRKSIAKTAKNGQRGSAGVLDLGKLHTNVRKKPRGSKKKVEDVGTFSFEPAPRTVGHVAVDGIDSRSSAAGVKGRIAEVLSTVTVMNDRIDDFQDKLNTLESKLDRLLNHSGL